VNEQLFHTQAAQMLDAINHSRTAMRTAIRAIFWLWFAAFAAMPLLLSGFYVRYFLR
jgi:hypothetical protein